MKNMHGSVIAIALVLVGAAAVVSVSRSTTAVAADPTTPTGLQPVESDMHEFMEYVFQPTYKRLKAAMAAEPADKNGWKGIKADALILAESGNLLMFRTPKDDAAAWNEISAAVRAAGGSLYQSAKGKDFKAARQHYEVMLQKCNACHDKFAGGEHQLTP